MWNIPSKKRLAKIPRLYETEQIPLREKLIHLHFFIEGCDWYVAEFDGKDTFFGFAILNNDYQMAEWGYVSFRELKEITIEGWLEVDCETEDVWTAKKASEIDKVRIAQGWAKSTTQPDTISKEQELIVKVRAGNFRDFQDLFTEVTSPYSDFFGIDPYQIWRKKETGQ